jgi:hypothetical protein
MLSSHSGTGRRRIAALNVAVSTGLGYLVLGPTPEWAVLILAVATLSFLLVRIEAP